LIDHLWGERPPASAGKLVQVYVSKLRKQLGARSIETVPPGYRIPLDGADIDSVTFERLVEEGRRASSAGNQRLAASIHRRALALWRGPALADADGADGFRREAERLEELRLACLEARIAAELELGRHEEVIAELTALVDTEPLRERPRTLLMTALYRADRQADALAVYRRGRAVLDELGLEPGFELRELERRILLQDSSLEAKGEPDDGTASSDLPHAPNPLVGRQEELHALRSLVRREDVRLLVLTGAGGSGKSRLALELARENAASFADGVALVELAPILDPELVLPAIARSLGASETSGESLFESVARCVQHRELLLVVDNAEHLRDAAPTYSGLVRRAPRLTVLVTSRAVLHLSGEHVFPVFPLPLHDAVELFRQRAQALDPGFQLDDGTQAAVETVCRRVDGLPLAIELGAARTSALTVRDLAERLEQRLPLLTASPRDLPARQHTLRATIDWSVDLLGDVERGALARMAVVPDACSVQLAEAVCGVGLDVLSELADSSLVQRLVVDGRTRLVLLETIREYAYDLLGDARTDAEASFTAHVTELVEATSITGDSRGDEVALIDLDLNNIRAALEYARTAGDAEAGVRIAGALGRYWWIRGYLREGRRHCDVALEQAGEMQSPAVARALRFAAGLAWAQGDHDGATAYATRAIEVARATGAADEELGAYTVLGMVASQRGDFRTASMYFERTLAGGLEHGIYNHVTSARLNLGEVLLRTGDAARAAEIFEQLLETHTRAGVLEGVGLAHICLGQARYALGEYELAGRHFDGARSTFDRFGFRENAGRALQGKAAVAARLGAFEDAASLLGRAEVELEDIGSSGADFDRCIPEDAERLARDALGDDVFERLRDAGAGSEPDG
jgi:predicted ATPase/DNA-binding SARP family transcriptional activator